MIWAILVTIVIIGIYMNYGADRAKRDWVKITSLLILSITWMLYIQLHYLDQVVHITHYEPLFYIFITILATVFISKSTRIQKSIVATRQSYWPIQEEDIRNYYKDRIVEKKDRIEVVPETNLKFWRVGNILTANLFKDIKSIGIDDLTTVKNVKELKKYPLYWMLFNRLKKIIEDKEIVIEYEALLKKNNNKAELFILYMWEHYTQDVNIGTANLEVIATRPIETHLIAALDNVDLNSIKRYGSGLWILYLRTHGRDHASTV